MKTAAFGFRMHSGWGAFVAVSGDSGSMEIVHRCRLDVIDPSLPGGKQPYHYAAELAPDKGEQHISNCFKLSQAMALTGISEALQGLNERQYGVTSAAVLRGSGRDLPSLPAILASHPLIHTAEGEFFRSVVIKACYELRIPVAQIRERELDDLCRSAFGRRATQMSQKISGMGTILGAPWTADYKAAATAALLILKSRS
jgi:hypothetical protein